MSLLFFTFILRSPLPTVSAPGPERLPGWTSVAFFGFFVQVMPFIWCLLCHFFVGFQWIWGHEPKSMFTRVLDYTIFCGGGGEEHSSTTLENYNFLLWGEHSSTTLENYTIFWFFGKWRWPQTQCGSLLQSFFELIGPPKSPETKD